MIVPAFMTCLHRNTLESVYGFDSGRAIIASTNLSHSLFPKQLTAGGLNSCKKQFFFQHDFIKFNP